MTANDMKYDNPPFRQKRQTRQARKEALIARLEQQRIDVLVESERFTSSGQSMDAAWHRLQRFKMPLMAVGGVVFWRAFRRPGKLVVLANRALAGYMLLRKVRRLS
ncbi:YqjK family protein [Halomonas sp. Bachu 37]|uniref:YqjK family protein n=1 Tax=Halomonas kashgarensis TaxID=3084920 RepID=UPI00321691B8